MRYKRNELGLTQAQARFVARGGMAISRSASRRANASRATRVRMNHASLSDETREQLRLMKNFLQSSK